MRDRNLEQKIKRVEAFIERWKELSQFLERGFKNDNFSDEEEAAFLDLKSGIAQEHEQLTIMLGAHESDRDDKALRLMHSVPSLAGFKELPEGMARKITSEWHSTFLSLQALLGRLKGRQEHLTTVSSFGVAVRRVFTNPLVIVFVTLAALYGVYKFAEDMNSKLIEWREGQP